MALIEYKLDNDSLSFNLELSRVGPQGIKGDIGSTLKGYAFLDFGTQSKTAEVVVTNVSTVAENSVILPTMIIENTAYHSADELLVDPIRLAVKDIVAGEGFTIYGEMDNAEANGIYKINWSLL